MARRLLLLIILFGWGLSTSVPVFASSYLFRPLPGIGGQSSLPVRKVVDDSNKGQWLVDIRGQLLFYDGTNLKPAVERTGKPVVGVTDIALVNDTLWLVKDSHAYSYSPQTSNLQRHNISQLAIESVVSLGNVAWFANRRGLYQLSDANSEAEFLPFPHPIKLAGVYVAGDHLYVATQQGVYEYLSLALPPTKLLPGYYVTAVEQDEKGELWFGTRQGVVKGREGALHPLQEQGGQPAVLSLQATSQGMWVGSTSGLYLKGFDMEEKAHFMPIDRDKFSLPGRRVIALHQDQHGTLWVSTPEGMSQLPSGSDLLNRVRLGKAEGEIDASLITDITYGSNGHYWLATDNGLFEISADFAVVRHIAGPGKIEQLVLSGDLLWILKEDGIATYSISQKHLRNVELPGEIRAHSVSQIMVDHFGSLWLGSEGGLYRYWPEFSEWMPFGSHWLRDPQGGEVVTRILQDSEYQVWVGTSFGLYKFDAGLLNFVPGSEGQGGVVDIYEDRMGQLWVASNYGVLLSPALKPLKLQDVQLSSNFARPYCLVGSSNGVWLSSSTGLSFISYYGGLKQHLGFNSALLPEDVGSLACLQDNVNALVLGHRQGLLSIGNDALFNDLPSDPKLVLSAVWVDNDIWPLDDSWGKFRRLPNGSSIAFKLEATPSQSTLYQYRLIDENDQAGEWQVANQPLLSVGVLSSGRYTLEVRRVKPSRNNAAELRYVFRVQPTWRAYQAFIGVVVLFALLLVLVFFYWRGKVFKDQAQQLKQAVFQKTAKIELQKKQLSASNVHLQRILDFRQHIMAQLSHEMRTPLQLSLGLLSELRPYCKPPDKIDIAEKNLNHALHLADQLLSRDVFAQIEPEKACEQRVSPIIQACCISWQVEAEKKQIALCLEENISSDTAVCLAPYHLEIMLGNLLSNAMKYTDSKGGITVNVKEHGHLLVISVSDTGRGMSEQTKAHLFDSYYQEEPTFSPESGFGLGLCTVKQLVEHYHGAISVISYQGVGSEFIIQLPLCGGSASAPHSETGMELPELPRWIMVIGDEGDADSDWSKRLSEHYHVTHTRGDYEDLMLIEDTLPELVIIDQSVLLPSDEALLRGLKDDFLGKRGPLLVALCSSSGSTAPSSVSWADCIVPKPLQPNDIVAKIDQLISEQQADDSDEITRVDQESQDNVRLFVSKPVHYPGFATSSAVKALHIPESNFQRQFKQGFGLSFKDYVTQFRFEQAAVMLKRGDNVEDVSLACGFKDPSYFCARFKAYSGQTPSEFASGYVAAE